MRGSVRGALGNWRPYRDQARSTCEGAEQRRASGRGGAGGKGPARGERGQQNAPRTQSRARRAKCAGWRAPNRGVRGSTPLPERGAQCGSSARWDLRGGRAATSVPTATKPSRPASPAIGEERVADQHPDACSHGGMLHGRHGRFVSPALTKGGAAALVLSPNRSRQRGRGPATAWPRTRSSARLPGARLPRRQLNRRRPRGTPRRPLNGGVGFAWSGASDIDRERDAG